MNSTLRGFGLPALTAVRQAGSQGRQGNKKFNAVAQPFPSASSGTVGPNNAPRASNLMTCLVIVMMIAAGIIALIWMFRPSDYQAVQPVPSATAFPVVDVPRVLVDNPGKILCTAVNAECGSMAMPAIRHEIASLERAALDVVYSPSKWIPESERRCAWADRNGADCESVKEATAQMLQWMAEEGR